MTSNESLVVNFEAWRTRHKECGSYGVKHGDTLEINHAHRQGRPSKACTVTCKCGSKIIVPVVVYNTVALAARLG